MKKLLLLGCTAALAFAGCQSTVNTVENTDKTMTPQYISDTRFITDGYLSERLALVSLNVSMTPDGFKRAQLEAVNVRVGGFAQMWSGMTGENPYPIKYKFTWFTVDGMAVESILSDWRTIQVIPGETVYLQSVAPNKNCHDFKVSLKEAN